MSDTTFDGLKKCYNTLLKNIKKDLGSVEKDRARSPNKAGSGSVKKGKKDRARSRSRSPDKGKKVKKGKSTDFKKPTNKPDYLKDFSDKEYNKAWEHLDDELSKKYNTKTKTNVYNLLMALKTEHKFKQYKIAKPVSLGMEDVINVFIYHYLDNNRSGPSKSPRAGPGKSPKAGPGKSPKAGPGKSPRAGPGKSPKARSGVIMVPVSSGSSESSGSGKSSKARSGVISVPVSSGSSESGDS